MYDYDENTNWIPRKADEFPCKAEMPHKVEITKTGPEHETPTLPNYAKPGEAEHYRSSIAAMTPKASASDAKLTPGLTIDTDTFARSMDAELRHDLQQELKLPANATDAEVDAKIAADKAASLRRR